MTVPVKGGRTPPMHSHTAAVAFYECVIAQWLDLCICSSSQLSSGCGQLSSGSSQLSSALALLCVATLIRGGETPPTHRPHIYRAVC